MAGVRGKSGGSRPGAGRKPKEPAEVGDMEPMEFLEGVMAGKIEASPAQVTAAKALMAYKHKKLSEQGKKQEASENAGKAAQGRFSRATPPKLVVNNK